MSMTREEAIIISAYTGYLLVDNFDPVHEFIEKLLGRPVWTHQLADPKIQAEIREKCKPLLPRVSDKEEQEKAQPLTIEELQQMHGQPVWIEDEKAWGIISAYDFGTWKEKPFVTFYYKSVRCEWDIERRGLKCYRHKPKGE